MYKLTVIAGPNRGTSYVMNEGEISIGRQAGNVVTLPSSKVSKKHCSLVVSNGEIVVKDQGSSNGTFVNGTLTKIKKLKPGDRISVGEYVFEITEPAKRVSRPAPAVAGLGNVVQFPTGAPAQPQQHTGSLAINHSDMHAPAGPPKDIKGRLLYYFDHHLMPIFYGMMLKNEWKMICIGLFAAFMVGNLVISVYPLLESSRVTIVKETGKRAQFMAKQIAEHNAPYLAARAETKTEIGSIENAEGVRTAILTDLDSRILAPSSKLNQYFTSGAEASAAVRAKNAFRNGRETGIVAELDADTIVAIEPVKIMSPAAGKNVTVAMAIVSVDTSLATPDLGEMGMVYSETLILTGAVGLLILFILYRLTLKPFQVLNEDMDKVLKGDMPQVTHEFKFEEMDSLWEIINSALQRVPRGGGGGGGGGGGMDLGGGGSSTDEYAGPVRMIGNFAKFGMVVLDGSKKILYMNPMFEEISGIRADGAIGQDFAAVGRDQSMGAFVTDICDRAPVGGDGVSEDYDFSGIGYKMHAAAFGMPGSTAKCFVLCAVRAEG